MLNKSIFTIADDLPPLQSQNSDMAFAFLYDGEGKLADGCNYIDSVEQTPDGPKRQVRWNFNAEHEAIFGSDVIDPEQLREIFNGETLTFETFATRVAAAKVTAQKPVKMRFQQFRDAWQSKAWATQNPTHPVAKLRARRDALYDFRGWLKSVKPLLCIRKNNKVLLMDKDRCAPEVQARLLEDFNR